MSSSISITGWNKKARMRANYLLLVMSMLGAGPALAEESQSPPLALLEYLGEWEDQEGRWIEPQLLELAMPGGSDEQVNEEQKDES